jgi:CubicO group peptidase (beta-lactamase class C family)
MNSKLQTFLNNQRIKYNLAGLIMAISHISQKKSGQIYTSGSSMSTVPTTKNMHYRIDGQGISMLTTLFLILVDNRYFSLNDKIGTFLPKVPNGKLITLRMLADMTAGLQDVIEDPRVLNAATTTVFRQWTDEELLDIIYETKPLYKPGERFYFGHITNMLLLSKSIEIRMRTPIKDLINKYIIYPLNLKDTKFENSQIIQEPVFHSFSKVRTPYYEDSTYWNPSWGSYATKINSNAYDVNMIGYNIGAGTLISKELYDAQMTSLVPEPNAKLSYGMGIFVGGFGLEYLKTKEYPYPVVGSSQSFNGYSGLWEYIPRMKMTINIQTNTFNDDDFNINWILENLLKEFSFPDLIAAVNYGNTPNF